MKMNIAAPRRRTFYGRLAKLSKKIAWRVRLKEKAVPLHLVVN